MGLRRSGAVRLESDVRVLIRSVLNPSHRDLRVTVRAHTLSGMDPGESIALLSLLLGGVLLAGGLFGAWSLGRMQGERRSFDAHSDTPEVDSRLARIERMIEAMALDMERLAEAQRFSAKRLAASEPRDIPEIPSESPRL